LSKSFLDADDLLKACYYNTMLNLELPESWDRLDQKQQSGEAAQQQKCRSKVWDVEHSCSTSSLPCMCKSVHARPGAVGRL
jgi:hypothetical protein